MSNMRGALALRSIRVGVVMIVSGAVSLSSCAPDDSVVQTTGGDAASALTEEDLEPGEFAAVVTYTPPGEGGEPFELLPRATSAEIFYDRLTLMCPRGWGLRLQISDPRVEHDFALMIWFEDPNLDEMDMTAGSGDAVVFSADIPEIEHGGEDWSVESGPVVVTASDGLRSSGHYYGRGETGIAWYNPGAEETGERFVLHSVVFREIETQRAFRNLPPCEEIREIIESDICAFTVDDQCFDSADAACEYSGCDASSCDILTTNPAQVQCN